jgi:hypothetical protein
MSWCIALTLLTALTLAPRFSISELILIVRVPARPWRLKDISIPSMRRNVNLISFKGRASPPKRR